MKLMLPEISLLSVHCLSLFDDEWCRVGPNQKRFAGPKAVAKKIGKALERC